ncbi:putative transcription factor [Naematelia encephala]|uniref:Putative transcription factor n=1 Tax=Naematelia encephala TaxID=71784 RepID=A0A1Y2ASB0_9TREE|nr:putative transcription factor [Naematelia encephala]
MYTTACVSCRKVRTKCMRSSRGQDMNERCERCLAMDIDCVTLKRRVGRQPGVKNRRRKESSSYEQSLYVVDGGAPLPVGVDDIPNPLHELASEAVRRQATAEFEEPETPPERSTHHRNSGSILDRYADWTDKIHATGRDVLSRRLDVLLSSGRGNDVSDYDESSVFCGRIEMARPDAAPEHDVITLQIISATEAQRLFNSFMELITNGSMYFDPRLHSLSFVRSRSSFLLAVILAIASEYRPLCASSRLHSQLMAHVARLEANVRNNHYKSIEIIQGLLLLASWTAVPWTLCRDKTWLYVSCAIGLAVELRLDTPLPYCVQTDPLYNSDNYDLLVRNAHRVCLLLYIHDRNMAMVAGRYPVFPESNLTSAASLNQWGKHARVHRFDAPITASVSLRKVVTEVQQKLHTQRVSHFETDKQLVDRAMDEWRTKWADEISSTLEYDIIARFSTFILALTLLRKQYNEETEAAARDTCETIAFEVCCASINHYKSWTGILNSATFDTSMVAFCAIYVIQSINHSFSAGLSDWSLFRLATLQELVGELESQAKARHELDTPSSMSVVAAMARQLSRGIRRVLEAKRTDQPTALETTEPHATVLDQITGSRTSEAIAETQPSSLDDLGDFMFPNDSMPFMPEWNLENVLPDMTFPWETNHGLDFAGLPVFTFN